MIRTLRVAQYRIEVDDRVEVAGGTNPLIDGLTIGLAERPRMIVVRADVRSDRGPNHTQTMGMGPYDDLLICGDHLLHSRRVFRRRDLSNPRQTTKIVHPFKHDHPTNARWRQDVAVEARQRVGA